MGNKRLLVAMSGGVDSTVAAYLAISAGYEVTGINFLMHPDQECDPFLSDACKTLKIPLIIRNCVQRFYDLVLLPGAQEYACGRTPNPCCECNEALKFHELLAAADELGIPEVATGHYVRKKLLANGNAAIVNAADRAKDQSYFLYRLKQNELKRILFPLGDLNKTRAREIAAEAKLPCAVRPDSQDACFQIPGECCGETLARLCGVRGKNGFFVYKGKLVGRHNGIHCYTIGQRKGLNVALGVPAYIKSIDSSSGNIELCTDQMELACRSFKINRSSWQQAIPKDTGELLVKVRYRTPAVRCRMEALPQDDGETVFEVIPEEPLRAVTPGQAAVFFDGETLLGGGIISNI